MTGWRFEGKTDDGKFYCYHYNNGQITDSEFFDTEDEAKKFISEQYN